MRETSGITGASIGRLCAYCHKPVSLDDRVALCDICCAVHHEPCWDRNGRCSTFRCAGLPRTMRGDDVPAALRIALARAAEEPRLCPLCANTTYAGIVQGKRSAGNDEANRGLGLAFVAQQKPHTQKGKAGIGLLDRMRGANRWFLPGAHVKGRSCGKCRRLFAWGITLDEPFVRRWEEEAGERFCPHCGTGLWIGTLVLKGTDSEGAQFLCDETPDLHRGWFSHQVLDRYLYSKWHLALPSLSAHSCPECHYTEVAGRPIYRFL